MKKQLHKCVSRFFCTLLLAPLLSATLAFSAQPAVPRSIADITALLDQYKPDPAAVDKLRAIFNAQPPKTADKLALIQFYDDRAWAADALGMGGQSVEAFRNARELARGMGGMVEVAAIQSLATQLTRDGNYLDSIKVREETLPLIENFAGRRNTVNYGLVFLYSSLGELDLARAAVKRQEEAFRAVMQDQSPQQRLQRLFFECFMYSGRARMHWLEGRYAEADSAYRQALSSCERDQGMAQIRVNFNLTGEQSPAAHLEITASTYDHVERMYADYLMAMGRLNEAELVTRNSLRRLLPRAGRYNSKTAVLISTYSGILLAQGRNTEAAAMARAAVEIFEKSGTVPESAILARARRNYAGALVARGQWKEALAEYDVLRTGLAADPRSLETLGIGDFNWGLALVITGRAAEAEKLVAPIIARTARIYGDAHAETALVRGLHGMALARMGERRRALEEFGAAIKVLIDDETGGTDRTPLHAQRVTLILDAYIDLLMEGGDAAAAAEAFRLADSARGSNVQRAIAASAARAAVPDARLAALIRRQQDAERRIELLEDVVTRQLAAPADQQLTKVVADVRKEIGELRSGIVAMKREISQSFPDYANLINPKPATVAQVGTSLREGEVLLSVLTTAERSHVWAVTNKGLIARHVGKLNGKEIAGMVARLRRALDPGDVQLDTIPEFDLATAHRLYAELLKPVEAAWHDANTLVVTANGGLAEIPLAILPTEAAALDKKNVLQFAGYGTVPWLARKVAVVQLPSVNSLLTLRALPSGNTARGAFLGFGDPQFDRRKVAAAKIAQSSVQMRNLSIPRVQDDGKAVDWIDYSQLAQLPDTRDEILAIAKALKADPQKDVYLGHDASKQQLKSLNLGDRRVIAFATHGLVPGDFPNLTEPALALAAPDSESETGLLTLEEILGLKLDADWVVLSACNTAAGDGAGAEAVSGLGRGFFYAGSRSLLVTHWPVETRSARMLVSGIFERYTNDTKITRAEALRQSMLSLMDANYVDESTKTPMFSYAHPIFWAPYAIIGDGGAR